MTGLNDFLKKLAEFDDVDWENYWRLEKEAMERDRRTDLKKYYDKVRPCMSCGLPYGLKKDASFYDNGRCPKCEVYLKQFRNADNPSPKLSLNG